MDVAHNGVEEQREDNSAELVLNYNTAPVLNEVPSEVPTSVYVVDLTKASELINASAEELIQGLRSDRAVDVHGAVVDHGQEVPFQAVGMIGVSDHSTPRTSLDQARERQQVRQVLVTGVAYPSALDTLWRPKCLIEIGGQTIIEHILEQLVASGMERIVISVSYEAEQVKETVRSSRVYDKVEIEWLELDYPNEGHARGILAARDLFPSDAPFLIHTADHIIHSNLIQGLASRRLEANDADCCVLIEKDFHHLNGLPATTVKCELDGEHVSSIGRNVRIGAAEGIDVGLFLCSKQIFTAIAAIAANQLYISFADALQRFAASRRLTWMETGGETWLGIETAEQLTSARELVKREHSIFMPWPVYVAQTNADDVIGDSVLDLPRYGTSPAVKGSAAVDSMTPKARASTSTSIVLGLNPADGQSSIEVIKTDHVESVFTGFVVGSTLQTVQDTTTAASSGVDISVPSTDRSLLSAGLIDRRKEDTRDSSTCTKESLTDEEAGLLMPGELDLQSRSLAKEPMAGEEGPGLDQGVKEALNNEEPIFLSFAMPEIETGSDRDGKTVHEAYLISAPVESTQLEEQDRGYLLAVPDIQQDEGPERPQDAAEEDGHPRPFMCRHGLPFAQVAFPKLPTDVQDIQLETFETRDHELEVQMQVVRRTPWIGFALLLTALFTVSSLGVAMDEQADAKSLVKLTWRSTFSALLFCPVALIVKGSGVGYSWETLRVALLSGVGYFVYSALFFVALDRTSLADAYLFNNSHSVLLVLMKLLARRPVSMLEGGGVVVAIAGGVISSFDHSKGGTSGSGPSLVGNMLALGGAFGGVLYLVTAKWLHGKLDLPEFMLVLNAVTAALSVIACLAAGTPLAWSMDDEEGFFGFLSCDSWTRLPLELYIVVVCSMVGVVCYIAVMKYFDPLVVSVVMLAEPVVALAIGIVVGVAGVPGAMSVAGGLVVILGTFMVTFAAKKSTDSYDVSEAVQALPQKQT